jgi:hypothetical protein
MTRKITATTIAALTLAFGFAAGPASAAHRVAHPGYEARAQAMPEEFGNGEMSGARAQALHECNTGAASKMADYTWGVRKSEVYESCMAKHGQPD